MTSYEMMSWNIRPLLPKPMQRYKFFHELRTVMEECMVSIENQIIQCVKVLGDWQESGRDLRGLQCDGGGDSNVTPGTAQEHGGD